MFQYTGTSKDAYSDGELTDMLCGQVYGGIVNIDVSQQTNEEGTNVSDKLDNYESKLFFQMECKAK